MFRKVNADIYIMVDAFCCESRLLSFHVSREASLVRAQSLGDALDIVAIPAIKRFVRHLTPQSLGDALDIVAMVKPDSPGAGSHHHRSDDVGLLPTARPVVPASEVVFLSMGVATIGQDRRAPEVHEFTTYCIGLETSEESALGL